ncbi:MAG: hypothetical protein WCI50_04180 [Actinomycetes bacterium]
MDDQHRLAALWHARGRGLLGLVCVVFPGLVGAVGLGRTNPAGRAAVRMLGVRDVALGLGAISGIREGGQAPEWIGWGALSDGVDALALLCTPGLPRRARLVGLLAAGSAVFGFQAARGFADERAEAQAEAEAALEALDADVTA